MRGRFACTIREGPPRLSERLLWLVDECRLGPELLPEKEERELDECELEERELEERELEERELEDLEECELELRPFGGIRAPFLSFFYYITGYR